MRKAFVLDTNVLLHNAQALFSFGDNEVVIPIDVLEELDRFKTENADIGRNSRSTARQLDRLRAKGSLSEGVVIEESGGLVRIDMTSEVCTESGLRDDNPDNRILSVACRLRDQGRNVIFVSKDINGRIKADALGIKAMDFEKQKVNFDEFYTGWRTVKVSGDDVDRYHAEDKLVLPEGDYHPNEFVLLVDEADEKHTALTRYSKEDNSAVGFLTSGEKPWGISARNIEQQMAIELLFDETIPFVTLVPEGRSMRRSSQSWFEFAPGCFVFATERRVFASLWPKP